MQPSLTDIYQKLALTDLSSYVYADDVWVMVVGLVGLIAGVIWAYFDE